MPAGELIRLVEAVRAGQGHDALFAAYGPRLYGYCWAVLRDSDQACGALSEALLAAGELIEELADPHDLPAWLTGLTRNECRRRLPAAHAQQTALAVPYGQPTDPLGDLVARALDTLTPDDRELLELSVRQGLSPDALARVLDASADTVRERTAVATRRFDDALAELADTEDSEALRRARPGVGVLLAAVPPPKPPPRLGERIAFAGRDPDLVEYRRHLAFRALPLGPAGFPVPVSTSGKGAGAVPGQAAAADAAGATPRHLTATLPFSAPVMADYGHAEQASLERTVLGSGARTGVGVAEPATRTAAGPALTAATGVRPAPPGPRVSRRTAGRMSRRERRAADRGRGWTATAALAGCSLIAAGTVVLWNFHDHGNPRATGPDRWTSIPPSTRVTATATARLSGHTTLPAVVAPAPTTRGAAATADPKPSPTPRTGQASDSPTPSARRARHPRAPSPAPSSSSATDSGPDWPTSPPPG